MWCPEGYYSWNEVLGHLHEYASGILSLVAVGGEPEENGEGEKYLYHTAEFYLKSRGITESEEEAELVVGITTALLLVCFLEDYPPVLAHLNGSKVRVDERIFCHKDQLENCRFFWPLIEPIEYSGFFALQRAGKFDINSLFERFCFIDNLTGEIVNKNGSKEYLLNGLDLEEEEADAIIHLVGRLSGFVLCWPRLPEGKELRDFLSIIEANETFTIALDYEFGKPSDITLRNQRPSKVRRVGRPSKRAEVAKVYKQSFPDGHSALGMSWKEALAVVNGKLSFPVSEDTLKRAVFQAR